MRGERLTRIALELEFDGEQLELLAERGKVLAGSHPDDPEVDLMVSVRKCIAHLVCGLERNRLIFPMAVSTRPTYYASVEASRLIPEWLPQ